MEEIIREFIEWAKDCGEDAFYVFDNTDEAIERFKEYQEKEDNFLGDAGS